MLKSFKYRIYPTKYQEHIIQKTFGCCRFVYNWSLAYRKEKYEESKEFPTVFDLNNYTNRILKNKYEWLREVDKWSLTNAIYNMDSAYRKFFKEHAGFPKYKKKKDNKKSYTTTLSGKNIEICFDTMRLKLPKLKWMKIKLSRKFEGKIKTVTISQSPSGKYFASILVETENIPIKNVDGNIGIDLGIKNLVTTSNGYKFKNISTIRKYERQLSKEQRKLAHKQKGSNNWNKQRIKVAKMHDKISNTRKDYLHKISHKLVNENQVIVSEDLAISNMTKNHHLAKSILDCGWYELTRQLQYKSDWNGRKYIKIGRFVKSSQTCNVCGFVNPETKKLYVREWKCPKCGTVHDRDVNAAINILNEGLRLLNIA